MMQTLDPFLGIPYPEAKHCATEELRNEVRLVKIPHVCPSLQPLDPESYPDIIVTLNPRP